jgi:hypothetical protein
MLMTIIIIIITTMVMGKLERKSWDEEGN